MVQSAKLGLGLVVVAISEVRHEARTWRDSDYIAGPNSLGHFEARDGYERSSAPNMVRLG
jgi:hypothetical protein